VKKDIKHLLARVALNFYPPYRGSGARVVSVSPDFYRVVVRIPLDWRTKNLVGTMFGGSMYTACDPIFMMMLKQILGDEYVVWDKAATIKFLKPGKTDLTGTFELARPEIDEIKALLEKNSSIDRTYSVELKDKSGKVCAVVEKLMYIAKTKGENKQKVRSIFAKMF
jgi:acyl-coenzyme A thioesterase PaaI-like protein